MTRLTVAISFLALLTSVSAREVHCIVNDVYAPYSDITLIKDRGNKYQLTVLNREEVLLKQVVSYTFSRRARYGTFKNSNIEINSLRLVTNKGVRSEFEIKDISLLTYQGLCKLHKD